MLPAALPPCTTGASPGGGTPAARVASRPCAPTRAAGTTRGARPAGVARLARGAALTADAASLFRTARGDQRERQERRDLHQPTVARKPHGRTRL